VEDGGEDGVEEGNMVVRMALKSARVEDGGEETLKSECKMEVRTVLSSRRWWQGWRLRMALSSARWW
jgi:hypothetical protein